MNKKRTAHNIYISLITVLGAAAIAWSIGSVIQNRVNYQWVILAYLTVLTGAFTVRIPRVNSKFSVSDTFIFINTILFGTAAGVLTAALDGFAGSLRSLSASKRKRTLPFNTAVLGLSVFGAGEIFFQTLGRGPLCAGPSVHILAMAVPLVFSALVYYLCNSVCVAIMLSLDGGGSALRMWRQGLFTTLGITGAGVAAGALIAMCVRSVTPVMLLIVVPILVAIYFINTIYLGSGAHPDPSPDPNPLSVVQRPAYRRFHYFMVALGLGFVALLLQNVLSEKIGYMWLIVAALAVLGGFINVKIPGMEIKFTIANTFVFANTMLFGPVVGGITAALDGLAGSLRCKTAKRRWEFTLFNVAAMAVSAYVGGALFFRILAHAPIYQDQAVKLEEVFFPTLLLAFSYYLLNTMGVAIIVALQAHKNILKVWRENLLWGMTIDVACAFCAVFVAAGVLALTPLIAVAVLLSLAVVYAGLKTSVARVTNS